MYLLALDLDETLLDEKKQIPASTVALLRSVMVRGHFVTLASGRMYPSVRQYAAILGVGIPVICYNGAQIKDEQGQSWPYNAFIQPELIREFVAYCRRDEGILPIRGQNNLYIQLYGLDADGNDLIVTEDNQSEELWNDPDFVLALGNALYATDRSAYQGEGCLQVGDFLQADLQPSPKMMIRATGQVPLIDSLLEKLSLAFAGRLDFNRSAPDLLEILPHGVDKGAALAYLADYLGVKQCHVIACGDSGNDLPMIKWAGIGVVVANSPDLDLRAAADYITTQPRSLGVEEAVKRFIR